VGVDTAHMAEPQAAVYMFSATLVVVVVSRFVGGEFAAEVYMSPLSAVMSAVVLSVAAVWMVVVLWKRLSVVAL